MREEVSDDLVEGVGVLHVADVAGTLSYANPRLAEILGTNVDELVGKSLSDIVSEQDTREEVQARLSGAEDRLTESFETLLPATHAGEPVVNEGNFHEVGGVLVLPATGSCSKGRPL